MSTSDTIQAAIAIVTFGAFVVALVSLIQSIRGLKLATFASVYQGIAGQMHDVDRLFVEMPELRPYFYENRELPDDERMHDSVLAAAELIVDLADNFKAQCPNLRDEHRHGYDVYFRYLYQVSPAIRQFWSAHKDWYGSDLDDLFEPPSPTPVTSESVSAETSA